METKVEPSSSEQQSERILLEQCSTASEHICQILASRQLSEDSTYEFRTTVEMVQTVVGKLITAKKRLRIDYPTLQKIHEILSEYQTLLSEYSSANRLKRIINSSRLRKRLEVINSDLHHQLKKFVDILKIFNSPNPQSINNDGFGSQISITEAPKSTPPKLISRTSEASLEQHITSPNINSGTDIIEDEQGKQLWGKHFNTLYAPLDSLLELLAPPLLPAPLNSTTSALLSYTLDPLSTSYISSHSFSLFLLLFGPFPLLSTHLLQLYSTPAFYGYLSRKESDLLLSPSPTGTFLFRFSRSHPNSIAISFKRGTEVMHILVKGSRQNGKRVLKVEEEEGSGAGERVFVDKEGGGGGLEEIRKEYAESLKEGLKCKMVFEKWFHGDLDSSDCAELLKGKCMGTFLVRFSSQPGCLAVTYVGALHAIQSVLIYKIKGDAQSQNIIEKPLSESAEKKKKKKKAKKKSKPKTPVGDCGEPGVIGYQFHGEKEVFVGLNQLIEHYSNVLQYPLPNGISKIADVIKQCRRGTKKGSSRSGSSIKSPRVASPRATASPREGKEEDAPVLRDSRKGKKKKYNWERKGEPPDRTPFLS
eukprot:TRINITY_DN21772_c0_g1_i1.p1 TRINITY_DN21772_c0_g1~~TRINITY_DN21772_c0_g1_i1.p1  ORF type:complete len:590 (+),score=141.19 TRINITY_DN21772_c0_g1_i1:154-1923(+)